MDTAAHFLIEFIPLGIVVVLGAIVYAAHRFRRGSPSKASLARCRYIVFEAEPLNLPNMEADLADNGWSLVSTQTTETDAWLYRFEKSDTGSRCLSEIFDFDKSMPRTSNRTSGAHSPIKISGHG